MVSPRASSPFNLQPRAAGPAGAAVLRDVPAARGAARARRAARPRARAARRRGRGQPSGHTACAVSAARRAGGAVLFRRHHQR